MYAATSTVHISNINTLKSIYYACVHSVIKYGITVWDNSSDSAKIFTLQKEIVGIMASAQLRTSCKSLFKQSEILPVPCSHVLALMNFIINNQENFQTYSSTHNINTRNKYHLLGPNANLSCCQKKYTLCWHQNFQQLTI